MIIALSTLLFLVLTWSTKLVFSLEDSDENCGFWAENGECEKNPNYMIQNCAKSCSQMTSNTFESFYDIQGEHDINGNPIDFNQFRDKVVYIVNVASYCGYTQSNYEILRTLRDYRSDNFEIIIAPCNQVCST